MKARIAIAVLVGLLALNVPQASAARRYKRKCDLLGCGRCYTSPAKSCYGRKCPQLYSCEADYCNKGAYKYSSESGMCDCKEGYGIVLGDAKYERYKRQSTPGYNRYYNGYHGYDKPAASGYKSKSKGYEPASYGYVRGQYVSGPYCQPCPKGYYSPGGEPLTTFCMPEAYPKSGYMKVVSPPAGANKPFTVKAKFDIPGGCGYYSKWEVLISSHPDGVYCSKAKLDSDCTAAATCKAPRAGTFYLKAKVKALGGIETDKVAVVVPDKSGSNNAAVRITIEVPFNTINATEREALAASVADAINTDLLDGTGATVTVNSITEGSIVLLFNVVGDPSAVEEALGVLQEGLPDFIAQLESLTGLSPISFEILVNGEPLPEGPSPSPGPGPSAPPAAPVTIEATGVAEITIPPSMDLTEVQEEIRTVATQLAGSFPSISIQSVTFSRTATTATAVVRISSPAAIAQTVIAAITGNQSFIRIAVVQAANQLFPGIGTFPVTVTARLV